jgi:hypothetical protein
VHNPTKLGVRTEGPYTIEHIHVNGNLTILLCEGITELINIRRVLPYRLTIPHTPVKTILSINCIEVSLLPLILFYPPHIQVSCRWSLFGSSFCLFIYGRASLAMEGKSIVPMEITFMDTEDEYKKYGTLRLLSYIYSNPFRFPISSLGLPNFPSQKD